jgi:hypothetical protein
MFGCNYDVYACGFLTCVRAEKMVATNLNLPLDTLHNGIQCCQPIRFDLLSTSPPFTKTIQQSSIHRRSRSNFSLSLCSNLAQIPNLTCSNLTCVRPGWEQFAGRQWQVFPRCAVYFAQISKNTPLERRFSGLETHYKRDRWG